jgi:Holliday junction resolvase-like predicted endonuclease
MNIAIEMIISILKSTRSGSVSHELINKQARVPESVAGKLLHNLQEQGLVHVQGRFLEADDVQRLKMAVLAIQEGADVERIGNLLRWREFEAIAAVAFERNGYGVKKNLRFAHRGRKWEIDIVGSRKPFAVCVDCKHWQHALRPSDLKRIVKDQVERTSALAETLPNPALRLNFAQWDEVRFVPAILSLFVGKSKFYDDVPVVSALQMQDFLSQLPAYADSLKHINRRKTPSGL